jgi:ABC-2 type transport system permease protein
MPIRGSHEGIDAASAPRTAHAPDGGAIGYDFRRTLPLRVEFRRQLARRRTQITLGFLAVLPFILVAAFKIDDDDGNGGAPALIESATAGAANFTLFTIFMATGFLFVVVFALFAGDTVASEASWSSLRYLLASPVPRAHLLRQKLLVALGYSVFAVIELPAVAYLAGGLFFGWAPARTPLGTTLGNLEGLQRLLIVIGYLAITMVFVSALAFLIGVWTDAPLGAVGGAVLLVIVFNILDAVTALGDLRRFLPMHYNLAWTDALAPTITWDNMARGGLWSVSYSLILFALAWWHFLRKDVTS